MVLCIHFDIQSVWGWSKDRFLGSRCVSDDLDTIGMPTELCNMQAPMLKFKTMIQVDVDIASE